MTTAPFATDTDYIERGYDADAWGSVNVLNMKLAEASRYIRSQSKSIDERIEDGDLDPELVKDVVCAMVARTEPMDEVPMGAESMQVGVDLFQRSVKFGGGGASQLFLTKEDRKKLGIGGQKAFAIDLAPPNAGANHVPFV